MYLECKQKHLGETKMLQPKGQFSLIDFFTQDMAGKVRPRI